MRFVTAVPLAYGSAHRGSIARGTLVLRCTRTHGRWQNGVGDGTINSTSVCALATYGKHALTIRAGDMSLRHCRNG